MKLNNEEVTIFVILVFGYISSIDFIFGSPSIISHINRKYIIISSVTTSIMLQQGHIKGVSKVTLDGLLLSMGVKNIKKLKNTSARRNNSEYYNWIFKYTLFNKLCLAILNQTFWSLLQFIYLASTNHKI